MAFDRPLAIIGLDCAEATLVFDLFKDKLPNLRRIMEQGSYGVLRSCHPPITIPAWACMTTSYDAGQMGYYGFRNRKDYTYSGLDLAFSNKVNKPRVWERVGCELGKKVIILGVPQTFPITRKPNGIQVTDFMTPSIEADYTWPLELKSEIAQIMAKTGHKEYILDVRGFRTDDKNWLLQEIDEMTHARFDLAEHFVTNHPWDFFWMVEMGTDRIHHGMWHCCDPNHPKYPGAGNPWANCILDYYMKVDERIGRLIDKMPRETRVVIVSDHGARPMFGGVSINEWLIRKGWLVLKQYPDEPMTMEKLTKASLIDWGKTRVWSEGGYYARVFFNVKGREPEGVIEKADYEKFRDEVIGEISNMPLASDEDFATVEEYVARGPAIKRDIRTRVHRPEELFKGINPDTVPTDLMVYFGNLAFRSVGTIGQKGGGQGPLFTSENDTGPDEANHDWSGIFMSNEKFDVAPLSPNAKVVPGYVPLTDETWGCVPEMRLLDVGASLMSMYGLPLPADMAGEPRMRWRPSEHDGKSLRAGRDAAQAVTASAPTSPPASQLSPVSPRSGPHAAGNGAAPAPAPRAPQAPQKKGLLKKLFGG